MSRPYLLIQAIFKHFVITILAMCLDNMSFLIKAYLVLSYQFLWGICAIISVIGAACLIVDIRFPSVPVLADIRNKRQSDFLWVIFIKMPVCQFFPHISRCLLRNHVGTVWEHDGIVIIVILPVLGITLQRSPIAISSTTSILIPGNGQTVIQSHKDIQVSRGGL